MDLTALAQALEQNNVGVGAGVVDRGGEGLAVRSDARIRNIGELAGTVIATREGVPIRPDQGAPVRLGQAIRYGSASENGKEVVVGTARSEEHTSELQSLMRISYAGFCLKKKIYIYILHKTPT